MKLVLIQKINYTAPILNRLNRETMKLTTTLQNATAVIICSIFCIFANSTFAHNFTNIDVIGYNDDVVVNCDWGILTISPAIYAGSNTAYKVDDVFDGTIITITPSAPSIDFLTLSTTPDAPTGVFAIAGNAQASVAFTAPANDGGSPIFMYTAKSSPGAITGSCTISPCTVTGLTNGTTYTFTVSAANAYGTGIASSASNSVKPSLPAPVVANKAVRSPR